MRKISVRKILTTFNLRSLEEYVNNVKLYRESTEVKNVYKKYEKVIFVSYPHQAPIHFVNYDFRIDFST